MSTAPHLAVASTRTDLLDWGAQTGALEGVSRSTGRLVHKGPDNRPEIGIWVCTPGRWSLEIPRDEFCYFVAGHAEYTSDGGETVEVRAGTAVLFPGGWRGACTVHETIRNSYMMTGDYPDAPAEPAKHLQDPLALTDLVDWGIIPTMIEGESRTAGRVIHKGPDGRSECGLWTCTPGTWQCHVTRDEFCHFLEGRCTYVHDSGDVIEVLPDTAAFFPKDWKGVCTVHETIRKVYMIR